MPKVSPTRPKDKPNKASSRPEITPRKKFKMPEMSPKVLKDRLKVIIDGLGTMAQRKLMMLKIIFRKKLEMPKDMWTNPEIRVKAYTTKQKDMPLKLLIKYQTLLKVPKEQHKM